MSGSAPDPSPPGFGAACESVFSLLADAVGATPQSVLSVGDKTS
jgi:hypothetical protein